MSLVIIDLNIKDQNGWTANHLALKKDSFKWFSSNNAESANYKEKEETLLIIVLSNKDSLKVYIFLTQPFQTFTMNAMGKEALLVPPLFFIISWFLLVTKE